MKNLRGGFRMVGESKFIEWTGPALALLACVFCFGILLAHLGFFQDDWHHVFFAYWQGSEGLQRFLLADRGPFAWPVYAALFKLLGFSPGAWHWWLMVIRFLTILIFWFSIRRIFPRAGSLNGWIAIVFAVYPIFTLQPLAVAYALHWSMYLVFMLSVLLMLEAAVRPRSFVWLTALALILQATHLSMIEYFSGLELARPVLLWLMMGHLGGRERLKDSARGAIPYLTVLLLYAIYRTSFGIIFGYDRFATLATLTELARSPLAGLQNSLQAALQDLVYILFSQWQAAAEPAIIDLSRPSTYFVLGSMVGFAILAFLIWRRVDRARALPEDRGQLASTAAAGLVMIILSMLPFWLTGFSIFQKNQLWSERLALAAMPGASMVIVGIVYTLIDRVAYRHLVLSVLLGLAVGIHVQTARSFQASWDKQRQLYWEMHWRAPALKPNTLIVADQEILFFMGIYPTTFALNLLYPQTTIPPQMSYWFNAGFEHVDFEKMAAGAAESFEKYGMTFTGSVEDVVAITFEPGSDQCLWILRPEVAGARGLTPPARTWLEVSNASRLMAGPASVPPAPIFGQEPYRTWCYYFERADLARQLRRWDEVLTLWQEASGAELRAPNGFEMIPFIEAHAMTGAWKDAQTLTRQAQVLPDRSIALLCDLWEELALVASPSLERDRAVTQVSEDLGCTP